MFTSELCCVVTEFGLWGIGSSKHKHANHMMLVRYHVTILCTKERPAPFCGKLLFCALQRCVPLQPSVHCLVLDPSQTPHCQRYNIYFS